MDVSQRKRAKLTVPLTILSQALGLPPDVHIEYIGQDHGDLVDGQAVAVLAGDGLPKEFLTTGPVLEAKVEYAEGQEGVEATISLDG